MPIDREGYDPSFPYEGFSPFDIFANLGRNGGDTGAMTGAGGGFTGFNNGGLVGAQDPALSASSNMNLASLLGDLDGGDMNGMGDLFKTLLFLQGRKGNGADNSPFSLFSGIQL